MNFKNITLYGIVILTLSLAYCSSKSVDNGSKKSNKSNEFVIMSYNVENLFDTIDEPKKADEIFLPNSEKHWNTKRYKKKINDLARVISSINKAALPDLVGLAEVENRQVVEDLANSDFLKKGDYGIVHQESPDIRGIDVALMYKKSTFTYIEHEAIEVNYDFDPSTKTRDILYVKGKINNDEILHVFVNHWSSRREGMEKTEPKRLHAASLVRKKVDEILKADKDAKIIIVGDFNDEPQNKSLSQILNAGNSKKQDDRKLYNLLYSKDLADKGTYNYKGNWNMLDNIVVSKALLDSQKGYVVSSAEAEIFQQSWMMYYNKRYDTYTPSKTYGGPNYYGGVSDHLPVYIALVKK